MIHINLTIDTIDIEEPFDSWSLANCTSIGIIEINQGSIMKHDLGLHKRLNDQLHVNTLEYLVVDEDVVTFSVRKCNAMLVQCL